LTASEFSAGDPEHAALLTQMGIQIQTMTDGRMKLYPSLSKFICFLFRCSIDS